VKPERLTRRDNLHHVVLAVRILVRGFNVFGYRDQRRGIADGPFSIDAETKKAAQNLKFFHPRQRADRPAGAESIDCIRFDGVYQFNVQPGRVRGQVLQRSLVFALRGVFQIRVRIMESADCRRDGLLVLIAAAALYPLVASRLRARDQVRSFRVRPFDSIGETNGALPIASL
jgi:hypothetical protein